MPNDKVTDLNSFKAQKKSEREKEIFKDLLVASDQHPDEIFDLPKDKAWDFLFDCEFAILDEDYILAHQHHQLGGL